MTDDTITVRYTCPHCEAVTSLERPPNLADRSVTKLTQPGWEYATANDSAEQREAADGIEFVCGEDGPVTDLEGGSVDGCGRPFYLNFVRYEQGIELEPEPPTYGGPRFDFNE
ncbi:hypothetical protein [Natronobacterium gregoryi]|uniref:DUF7969 domain-containing protein n=2 Tax=Natronobacterium gregoryi TaxID=44930 RepID=L0ALS5_NATGS|nr:hypothetical protein [Natronobacterium gregoryi]AFZ74746.1 hypothetical protein Natgr_3635 [Natronobacterium gregoryi SP2]ELY73446.1 hypothetical protein C490_01235 [Natronobacterium gregoryi SP2]PLK20988.1 hypothetical protein CYV19_06935 [Natronobacterium gregoryi SP2]SFJ03460.1 hypothetical protein SAMN05443661_11211 [Natronobacterium gregoryi]